MDASAFSAAVVDIVRGFLEREFDPIIGRLDAVERRLAALPSEPEVSEDDLSALKSDIESLRRAMADLPKPEKIDVDAAIERARAAVAVDINALREMVKAPPDIPAMVADAVAAIPAPANGKDADPEVIRQIVADAIAALPPAKDGKDVDPAEVERMVVETVEKAVAALPPAQPGKDADPEHVVSLVRSEAERILAGWERPQNGKSVTIEEVRPVVDEAVAKAVESIPVPKDGVNLAGALIDRDGNLVLTLSNGETKELGKVVGRDGPDADMAALERSLRDMVAAIPAPKDGLDGVGFDDMSCDVREDGVYLVWEKGDLVKEARLPIPMDRGVWKEGQHYRAGDGVTWGGSFWIAQADKPEGKPDAGKGWRLAVKKGRDGKDVPSQPVKAA